VNRSFPSSLAAVLTRCSPGDTLARLGVRRVLACPVFSSVPSLGSTNSGSGRPSPFAGFPATMEGSDFSSPCITGFGSSPSRCGPDFIDPGRRRDLPVPAQGAYAHAGVYDRAGPASARAGAPGHVAFHSMHSVGVPEVLFSRFNTQPMRTPVNASPKPSRVPAHDSGTVWFARPSLAETCTLYSLPVSRRTHCQLKQRWYAPAVGGAVVRCGEVLGTPIGLSPSQPRGDRKLTSTPLS
jgi:hypothetical protein